MEAIYKVIFISKILIAIFFIILICVFVKKYKEHQKYIEDIKKELK